MPDNKELSFSADCNDNQDTQQRSNIDDYHERRRMQNRIAQRKYREFGQLITCVLVPIGIL